MKLIKIILAGLLIFFAGITDMVFADDNPPSIKNIKWYPEYPNTNSIIRISATVTDADGIAWVRLSYCFGGSCFPPVEMVGGSNDKYSCQIGPFEEGWLEFHIIAQDTMGNTADTPEYSVYIDGTSPSISIISPEEGEIASHTMEIEWSASDNYDSSPDIEIKYSDNDGVNWYGVTKLVDYEGNRYVWNISSLSDNTNYLIKLIATDDAGNSNSDTSGKFTIDNTPPSTTIFLNGSKNGEWFISNVSVALVSIDNTSGVATIKYKMDNGEWKNYTSSFIVSESGLHTIYYYSIDVAGNSESIKNITFKIDKNIPLIEIIKPRKGYFYLMGKEMAKISKDIAIVMGKINVVVNASDKISGMERVEFYLNGDLKSVDESPPYEWEWNEKSFFINTIKVIAYNNAGNSASDEVKVFAIII